MPNSRETLEARVEELEGINVELQRRVDGYDLANRQLSAEWHEWEPLAKVLKALLTGKNTTAELLSVNLGDRYAQRLHIVGSVVLSPHYAARVQEVIDTREE